MMSVKLRVPYPLPSRYRNWSVGWKDIIVRLDNRVVQLTRYRPVLEGVLIDGWNFTPPTGLAGSVICWAPDEFIDWTWFKQGRCF